MSKLIDRFMQIVGGGNTTGDAKDNDPEFGKEALNTLGEAMEAQKPEAEKIIDSYPEELKQMIIDSADPASETPDDIMRMMIEGAEQQNVKDIVIESDGIDGGNITMRIDGQDMGDVKALHESFPEEMEQMLSEHPALAQQMSTTEFDPDAFRKTDHMKRGPSVTGVLSQIAKSEKFSPEAREAVAGAVADYQNDLIDHLDQAATQNDALGDTAKLGEYEAAFHGKLATIAEKHPEDVAKMTRMFPVLKTSFGMETEKEPEPNAPKGPKQ